jgi:hypothetical protein
MTKRLGDWVVFCDICGQRYYASETVKLPVHTGRGGLIVCRRDADAIDYSTIPYNTRKEQNVPFLRSNHTSTLDSSPIFDYESDTVENISSYQYLSPSQFNDVVFVTSQDENVWIATSQEI